MSGIPLLEKLVTINHGSIYKTKPFEALLREKFQDRPLFGGANEHSQSEMLTKVAVTSTTSIDQHSVILTNYNRPDAMEDGKCFPNVPYCCLGSHKAEYFTN